MLLKRAELEAAQEQRGLVLPHQEQLIKQRAAPSVFIVDEGLRMLYHHCDPQERRKDCRPEGGALPTLVAQTTRKLLRSVSVADWDGSAISAAPNSSVIVRVVKLEGSGGAAFAVLVERFKTRDHLRVFAERWELSPRERDVLALLVKGSKNAEIAKHLQVAETTAIFHVKRLMAKTDSRNRTELVAKVVG